MKNSFRIFILFVSTTLISATISAQCSICSKTASQMGEEAGRGLNGGILYLAAAPLLIVAYIGYRWWRNNY